MPGWRRRAASELACVMRLPAKNCAAIEGGTVFSTRRNLVCRAIVLELERSTQHETDHRTHRQHQQGDRKALRGFTYPADQVRADEAADLREAVDHGDAAGRCSASQELCRQG